MFDSTSKEQRAILEGLNGLRVVALPIVQEGVVMLNPNDYKKLIKLLGGPIAEFDFSDILEE